MGTVTVISTGRTVIPVTFMSEPLDTRDMPVLRLRGCQEIVYPVDDLVTPRKETDGSAPHGTSRDEAPPDRSGLLSQGRRNIRQRVSVQIRTTWRGFTRFWGMS